MNRRTFLASSLAAGPVLGQSSLIRRYIDPSTEIEMLCLSDPAQASYLPFSFNRSSSSRQGFVIYSKEGPQGTQAYRLELKGGVLKQLTSAKALHRRALALSPDDKTIYYSDGEMLLAGPSGSLGKGREVFAAKSEKTWEKGFSLSEDGSGIAFIDNNQLHLLNPKLSGKAAVRLLGEVEADSGEPILAKAGQIIYRDRNRGLHHWSPEAGKRAKRLPIEGKISSIEWNPDGRSFLFLRTEQGPGIANSLHEYSLDTQKETLVGKTSQFVSFQRNADSSVFVGASGSKAQPYVLLMLRITRRELALCEHKASDGREVSPVFSPSSKRIFFQSDRLGKSAIFSVAVERLVEPTEAEEEAKKS